MIVHISQSTKSIRDRSLVKVSWYKISSLESLFGGDFVSNKRIFWSCWAFSDLTARIVSLISISLFVKFSESLLVS